MTLTWLTLAAALAYLCRNAVSVAESTIRDELHLTLNQSGWFMGAFFWSYAMFQVPSGWLSQKLGTRVALTAFALAWSGASLGLSIAPGLGLLIVAQLLMGVAQAGIFPASCNSVGHWLPLSQRSLGCGILAAGMQVGAIAASGLTGPLMDDFGWRRTFVLLTVPGVAWVVWFWFSFRDRPQQCPSVNAAELAVINGPGRAHSAATKGQPGTSTDWLQLLSTPLIWLLCGQQICRAAGYMFFASWFPTFLQETRNVSVSESGYLQGLVLAGTLVGSIFGGMLTDWIWRTTGNLRLSRSGVGAAFLAACGVLILGAWFVQNATVAVTLLALGSLFAALAGPCAFATTIDIGGDRVPQIFGLMNMTGNIAAAICPILVGKLFATTANWNVVLLMFAAVYLAGAVCWIFIDPRSASADRHMQPVTESPDF